MSGAASAGSSPRRFVVATIRTGSSANASSGPSKLKTSVSSPAANKASGQNGRFKAGRLPSFLDQPDRSAYLVRVDGAPAGFVLLTHENDGPRSIGEFFVVRGVRRRGVGHEVATRVLRESPGPWIVAFQEENPKAARFWRRVATDVAGQGWSEERLPVPDKPWLPPDVWLSLLVP